MPIQVWGFVYWERDFESWRFYVYFWLKIWLPSRGNIPGAQEVSIIWGTFSAGHTRFFQFSVLPFGLSSAPYLFTKLLKPLVKKWRSEAKSVVVYLDDGLGAAADKNKAKIASLQVHADLLKSPNESKCVWEPI